MRGTGPYLTKPGDIQAGLAGLGPFSTKRRRELVAVYGDAIELSLAGYLSEVRCDHATVVASAYLAAVNRRPLGALRGGVVCFLDFIRYGRLEHAVYTMLVDLDDVSRLMDSARRCDHRNYKPVQGGALLVVHRSKTGHFVDRRKKLCRRAIR